MTAAHSSAEANRATVLRYFDRVNAGLTDPALNDCIAPDIIQEELPNQLLPNGATRDLQALREASERGKALMAEQHFAVRRAFADGDTVIVESVWTGTVGVDDGPFKAGQQLRAQFAQFFELRDGQIIRIRNYDCFDPW